MAVAKPLALPTSKSKWRQKSSDEVSLLNAADEEVHLMTEIPWDFRGADDIDTLSSDEELLEFTSDQSRLVLNSSSDDDLIDVSPDGRNNDNVRGTRDKIALSRYQKCYRIVADHIGLLYAFISCIFFATSTICVKFLTEKVNSIEILFWRFILTLVFLVPLIVYSKPKLLVTKKQLALLFGRAIFGASAVGLLYTACQMTAVGDANAIFFCNPIFTVFLACSFLKEGCNIWDVLLSILSVGGVFLITRPPFIFGDNSKEASTNIQMIGSFLALGGAMFAAVTFVVLRKLGKDVHYLTTIFYYSVITILISGILLTALQWWTLPGCGHDRIALFMTGVLGFLGQIFLTKAFKCEKAGYVSMMRTNDVVVAFILQFFVFGTVPLWTSIAGAFLVVASSVGINFRKWLAKKDDPGNSGHDNRQEERQIRTDSGDGLLQDTQPID